MNQCRILVVDDEPLLAEITAELLEGESYATSFCTSAKEALAMGASKEFDFIISDLSMPDMGGIEMIRQWIQTHDFVPKVIFITGHTEVIIPKIEGVEVLACLTKPVDERDILRLISTQSATKPAKR